ncbi:UDP-glucose 4-epimerase [Acholeplasma morum]|uniref:NAD-dependent epimerase/dehydratase family protein n=1 Tax=Paracholeplasma morum TaxID=264637 RepID=UPI001959D283|nr:NAD-dependent epimerase/dehydratase family protein [Paracholeplasma morum]MBM7453035.1 UDP-glucose 4-epimerase [Paracholeplasma morum]
MKRVLITGANSYVGTNVEKWLMRDPKQYYVETLDMINPNWKDFDFSRFDVVFHVAGIAHVSTKKSMKDLYFKVNRDLTIETAIKAKESGVKQFIFMSSMIVYSSKETRITLETKPNPDNFYGLSKLQAEEGILPLQSEDFNVCILRPPMIYGPRSKGNFPKLVQLSKMSFIFPKYHNKRSSLFITNLCIFIKYYIDNASKGINLPQNDSVFSIYEIVKQSRKFFGKRTVFISTFNPFIFCLTKLLSVVRKMFGDFYYDVFEENHLSLVSLEESIVKTLSYCET